MLQASHPPSDESSLIKKAKKSWTKMRHTVSALTKTKAELVIEDLDTKVTKNMTNLIIEMLFDPNEHQWFNPYTIFQHIETEGKIPPASFQVDVLELPAAENTPCERVSFGCERPFERESLWIVEYTGYINHSLGSGSDKKTIREWYLAGICPFIPKEYSSRLIAQKISSEIFFIDKESSVFMTALLKKRPSRFEHFLKRKEITKPMSEVYLLD